MSSAESPNARTTAHYGNENNLINLLNSNNDNNPCAQFFSGAANAIAALNAIPFTPGQLANYRTGISMNIPSPDHGQHES